MADTSFPVHSFAALGEGLSIDNESGQVMALGTEVVDSTVSILGCDISPAEELPPLLPDGTAPAPGSQEADATGSKRFFFDVKVEADTPARKKGASTPASAPAVLESLTLGWAAMDSKCIADGSCCPGCTLDSWVFDIVKQQLVHQSSVPLRPGVRSGGVESSASASASASSEAPLAAGDPPCGCSGTRCTSHLCMADVALGAADQYGIDRPARKGDVWGVELDLANGTLSFSQNGSSLGQAFRRIGNDLLRGSGKRLVPVVHIQMNMRSSGSSPVCRIRLGGPRASAAFDTVPYLRRGKDITFVGFIPQLQAVAEQHAQLRKLEEEQDEDAGQLHNNDGVLEPGKSKESSFTLPLAGSSSADVLAGARSTLPERAPPATDKSAPAAAVEPEPPRRVLTDSDLEPCDVAPDPDIDALGRHVAAQLWQAISASDNDDATSAASIAQAVWDMMGGDPTVLGGLIHPLKDELEGATPANREGENLLHTAATAGKVATAEILMETSMTLIDPNARAKGGDRSTPLHRAVQGGHAPFVRFLLFHCSPPAFASCTKINASGLTPVDLALRLQNVEVLRALVDAGVLESMPEVTPDRPIETACVHRSFQRLNDAIFSTDEEGMTTALPDGRLPLRLILDSFQGKELFAALVTLVNRFPAAVGWLDSVIRDDEDGSRPLCHKLISLLGRSSLTESSWDLSAATFSSIPSVSADGKTVTFADDCTMIPLRDGASKGMLMRFRIFVEHENSKDETTAVGVVRNRPKSGAYTDASDSIHHMYRLYNGEVHSESKVEDKVAPTRRGQSIDVELDLRGETGVLRIRGGEGGDYRVAARNIPISPEDVFRPCLGTYAKRAQVLTLESLEIHRGEGESFAFARDDKSLSLDREVSPALAAAASGSFEEEKVPSLIDSFRVLLDRGVDPSAVDSRGRTVLHEICRVGLGSSELSELLLARGVDPDQPDASGRLPLRECGETFAECMMLLHNVRLTGIGKMSMSFETPVSGSFEAPRHAAAPLSKNSSAASSGESAGSWFDRVCLYTLADGTPCGFRYRVASALAPGVTIPLGALVVRGPGWVEGDAVPFVPGTLQHAVTLPSSEPVTVRWHTGETTTRDLDYVCPFVVPIELDPLCKAPRVRGDLALSPPSATPWPHSESIDDLELRYRARPLIHPGVTKLHHRMFVTRGPTWPDKSKDSFRLGFIASEEEVVIPDSGDAAAVLVTWLNGSSDVCALGGDDNRQDLVVVDVDPVCDVAPLIASGAGVRLEALHVYSKGLVKCYSDPEATMCPPRVARGSDEDAIRALLSVVSPAYIAPPATADVPPASSLAPPSAPSSPLDSAASAASAGGFVLPKNTPTLPHLSSSRSLNPARCAFDLQLVDGSTDLTVSPDGRTVSASTHDNRVALVSAPMRGGKRYIVKMHSVEDNPTSQCTCFGVAQVGMARHNYSTVEYGQWCVRSFNGQLYGVGSTGKTVAKIGVKDSVELVLDLRPGVGDMTIRIAGEDQGVCFTGLPTDPTTVLLPAAYFYSSAKSIMVESVSELSEAEVHPVLELRSPKCIPCSPCSLCSQPARWADAWVDVINWNTARRMMHDRRRQCLDRLLEVSRTGDTVTMLQSGGEFTEVSVIEVHDEFATALVRPLRTDDSSSEPATVVAQWTNLVETATKEPLLPASSLQPSASCLCPSCFLASAAPVCITPARAGLKWHLPNNADEDLETDEETRDRLRRILAMCDDTHQSVVHDFASASRVAWLQQSSSALGCTGTALGPGWSSTATPTPLSIAFQQLPNIAGLTAEDDLAVQEALSRLHVAEDTKEEEGDIPAELRLARRLILGNSIRDVLNRIIAIGRIPSESVGMDETAWPLPATALFGLVITPGIGDTTSTLSHPDAFRESGPAVWVRLSRLFHGERKLSLESADSAHPGDVMTLDQWRVRAGKDLPHAQVSPPMDCILYLLKQGEACMKGSGEASVRSEFLKHSSRLLNLAVMAQLTGRIEWLSRIGARMQGLDDSPDSISPLMAVCSAPAPSLSMVTSLLELGANPLALDSSRRTPVHAVSRSRVGAVPILERLLDRVAAMAEEHLRKSTGEANESAIRVERDAAVKQALEAHDAQGRRALHGACRSGSWDAVEFILDHGVVLDNEEDAEPGLHIAVRHSHKHLIPLLVDNGADVNSRNPKTGNTALHLAVSKRSRTLVAALLECGAMADCSNRDGLSPLDLARRMEAHDVLGLLHEAMEEQASSGRAMGAGAAAELASMVELQGHIIAPKDVSLGSVIGEGGFGLVMEASLSYRPGTKVVVKQLKTVTKLDESNKTALKQEVTNMRLACSIHHPNILQFIGLVAEDNGMSGNGRPLAYGLVLEYAGGGSLRGLLDSPSAARDLPLLRRISIMAEVASGLAFLHTPQPTRSPMAHRDLKPDNILLDESLTRPMISDFGLSKVRDVAAKAGKTTKFHTTQQYRAPEAWKRSRERHRGPQPTMTPEKIKELLAQDIFSLGVMIWEVVTLRAPWAGDSDVPTLYQDIVEDRFFPGPVDVEEVIDGQVPTEDDGKEYWADLEWFEMDPAGTAPASVEGTQVRTDTIRTLESMDSIGEVSAEDDMYFPEDYIAALAMPRALRKLIARCCAFEPGDRPSAVEVTTTLREIFSRVDEQICVERPGIHHRRQTSSGVGQNTTDDELQRQQDALGASRPAVPDGYALFDM
jgi:serine/threonine protein kinase/ankyrin repeat protein